jgi:hypothetical protein
LASINASRVVSAFAKGRRPTYEMVPLNGQC